MNVTPTRLASMAAQLKDMQARRSGLVAEIAGSPDARSIQDRHNAILVLDRQIGRLALVYANAARDAAMIAELFATQAQLHAEMTEGLDGTQDAQGFADRVTELGYVNRQLIALGAIPVIA